MTENISFVQEEAIKYDVYNDSKIYKYIDKKTRAAERDSKSRRSLGNLYALYALCNEYSKGFEDGSTFTHLMDIMKSLPFGSKLQNHPLDNRLNDEFKRQNASDITNDMLPVQHAEVEDKKKTRKISVDLLSEFGMKPKNTAAFVVAVIDRYVQIISDNQTAYLQEIEAATEKDDIINIVRKAFNINSDARLFEIVSYALLYIRFYQDEVTITYKRQTNKVRLSLYRTGRTNANDGGIDFVLSPLGEFFQVTETLDFKKYFLDFDKMNRYKVSFVIKTDLTPQKVREKVHSDATSKMDASLVNRYMSLFGDIYTLNELDKILVWISESDELIHQLTNIIISSFKLEFGLLD